MNYGDKLKYLRVSKGLKQDDVALAIGVTAAAISLWERASCPPLSAIEKICQYHKVTLSQFFAEEGQDQTSFPSDFSRQDIDRLRAIESLPEKEKYILNQIIDLFIAENRAPRWRVD
jgi:transcriptional regulator with XRE-family HTH domain